MRLLKVCLSAAALLAVAGGCGDSGTTPGGDGGGGNTDLASHDLAAGTGADMAGPLSQCGHPGDPGNSLGVGKYCTTISDCTNPGMTTNICSALGNGATPSPDDTYFCTIFPCTPGTAGQCGTGASCVCAPQGCACTPLSCQTPGDM